MQFEAFIPQEFVLIVLHFAANIPFIYQHGILVLVHYWSIGVEEQFYLFWPWIVNYSKAKLLRISVLIFILIFLIKLASWYLYGNSSWEYRFFSITRFYLPHP